MDVSQAASCESTLLAVSSELTYSRVVSAATVRIIYLIEDSTLGDLTSEAWPATLCALIVESLSVIAACIPYLKPFLDSLESGMMNNDQLRREGMSDLYGRGRSKGTGSHQPKKASYDVLGLNKTEYLRCGSFSHNIHEDSGVFCGSSLPMRSVATAREAMGVHESGYTSYLQSQAS